MAEARARRSALLAKRPEIDLRLEQQPKPAMILTFSSEEREQDPTTQGRRSMTPRGVLVMESQTQTKRSNASHDGPTLKGQDQRYQQGLESR